MTSEALKEQITTYLPSATFDEGTEWLNAHVASADWLPFATWLKDTPGLDFDYCFCLTCIDWKTHLTMVYHLTSTNHRIPLVVKCKLDRTKPEIESVAMLWRTADFHEREVYELFGVNFLNHPDLRLLILPDGWEGRNPLRKDYEDAVNMIKL
jgi:NADH:ubiquinone oxidoreductase subunit C